MKRVTTVGEEEEEEDDDLLDDGWVQRDEQKDQLNRRLKRTGYGRWRKSLDAATRYELEREKANMTVSIEVDDDYDSFQKRRRDQATSGSTSSTSTTSSPLSSCRSSFSASSSQSLISSRESSSGAVPSPSSAPGSSSSSSSSSQCFSLTSSKSTSSAGWVTGGRANTRAQQRRSIGATRAHELERALEREAQAMAGDELTTPHGTEEEENELQHNNDSAREKKSTKTKTKSKEKGHTETKKKQGSKLLFWKKGKSEAEEAADRPTRQRGEEGAGSAVPERERSGTMDLYAAMGSGYHKQHLALGQQ